MNIQPFLARKILELYLCLTSNSINNIITIVERTVLRCTGDRLKLEKTLRKNLDI